MTTLENYKRALEWALDNIHQPFEVRAFLRGEGYDLPEVREWIAEHKFALALDGDKSSIYEEVTP